MPSESNKKLLILYVLKVLENYSDENNPLTYKDIIKKIYNDYGMSCERKAIAANIDLLIDMDYDIVRLEGGGCYLGERLFEESELKFLVDAIFSSKSIPANHAKNLIDKLISVFSLHERKSYSYACKTGELTRTGNKSVFYNIDMIKEAIEKKKKISFIYNTCNEKGELIPRKEKRYLINPYFMLNNNGKYFLVCNLDGFEDVSNYKIELITDIRIEKENQRPLKDLKDVSGSFDIAKYANENVYLFGEKAITAKLRIYNPYTVASVIDNFGEKTKITKKDDKLYAEVRSSPNAIIYWALQYGENVEIVEPIAERQKIKDIIKLLNERYK